MSGDRGSTALMQAGNTLKYRLLRRPLVMLRHRGVSRHDVFLASYPRSGNTWLRFMLAHALGHEPDFEKIERMIPPVGRQSQALIRLPNGGRLIKSHERRNFPPGQRCRRAVYLVRDGRDVAVSYYFFMQRYAKFFGPFSEFLPMFLKGRVDGYGPWHLHVRSWLESPLAASEDLLAIRYEDMLRNPEEILGRVVEFVGAAADPTRLHDAIEAHRFERMRQRSRESPTMKAKAVRDDIPTVRAGKVGGWRDHFGDDERALFSRYAGAALERYGYDPI